MWKPAPEQRGSGISHVGGPRLTQVQRLDRGCQPIRGDFSHVVGEPVGVAGDPVRDDHECAQVQQGVQAEFRGPQRVQDGCGTGDVHHRVQNLVSDAVPRLVTHGPGVCPDSAEASLVLRRDAVMCADDRGERCRPLGWIFPPAAQPLFGGDMASESVTFALTRGERRRRQAGSFHAADEVTHAHLVGQLSESGAGFAHIVDPGEERDEGPRGVVRADFLGQPVPNDSRNPGVP